ncbi:MAG: PhzF family phenazine biosynthesis protein, partial [Bacteroidales bacterium]|nr:PhzF family phenazine biosynthesis protein [Bacteroidales bacterium]
MKYYNIDAFTDSLFGRNLADLVLLGRDKFPADKLMQQIAAKMRSWETAFVQKSSPHEFTIRYFTPIVEVPLCGY